MRLFQQWLQHLSQMIRDMKSNVYGVTHYKSKCELIVIDTNNVITLNGLHQSYRLETSDDTIVQDVGKKLESYHKYRSRLEDHILWIHIVDIHNQLSLSVND